MTTDASVQRAIDDANLDAEMQELLRNKPSYSEAVPGTNADLESGRSRAVVSTAAEIPMWNRETGEQSIVIFDALRARMRQRFSADHPNPAFRNQRVYTLHAHGCSCGQPGCEPAPAVVRGNLACPLSLAHPDRSEVEEMGLGSNICAKPAYFMSEMDVDLHVEKSHPRFWQRRERARVERERREDRERMNAMMAVLEGRGSRSRKADD